MQGITLSETQKDLLAKQIRSVGAEEVRKKATENFHGVVDELEINTPEYRIAWCIPMGFYALYEKAAIIFALKKSVEWSRDFALALLRKEDEGK